MEKRIELEKRARKPSQITELNLDNCRSTSIVGLTDEYTALESLSLINVGLTTLKGFPKLPNLKKLELSDNRISNGLNYLTTSPKLQSLNLSGNKIKDLKTLEPLQEFKHLSVLDLFNNEATQIENYREKVFELLPSLKFLDGFDCHDIEVPSDGEEDDEVNGNDSEDEDKQTSFCLNGLEIDLAELAELERRVEAKKKAAATASSITACAAAYSANTEKNEPKNIDDKDDLDLYLAQLHLKEEAEATTNNSRTTTMVNDSTMHLSSTTSTSAATNCNQELPPQRPPIKFAILLYWFLAILNLAQAALYSGEGEEEDDDDPEGGDYCSTSDVSDVSFEDGEEHNSDYDENDDDDDEDVDSDDEAAGGGAAKTGAKDGAKVKQNNTENEGADAAESEARGKKRKHDG